MTASEKAKVNKMQGGREGGRDISAEFYNLSRFGGLLSRVARTDRTVLLPIVKTNGKKKKRKKRKISFEIIVRAAIQI